MQKKIAGGTILFDAIDKPLVEAHNWWLNDVGYAVTINPGDGGMLLHRKILESMGPCPEGHISDHRNGRRFDNRRFNLRWSTRSENNQNAAKTKKKFGRRCRSQQYKGVYRVRVKGKARRRWGSHIGHEGKLLHLGYFNTARDAALRYNEASKSLFGPYARPNIIKTQDRPKQYDMVRGKNVMVKVLEILHNLEEK